MDDFLHERGRISHKRYRGVVEKAAQSTLSYKLQRVLVALRRLERWAEPRICFVRREDVVDGVCDESVRNGCSAGTPNPAAYPTSQ